jgi:hypothetical protein
MISRYVGGISLGICFGAALGAATHNVGLGIALGVAVSFAFGSPLVLGAPSHARKKVVSDKPLPHPLGL